MPGFMSHFVGLRCVSCGREYDAHNAYSRCVACHGLLDAQYDYPAVMNVLDIMLGRTDRSIWRWRELLPVHAEENIVTLGEGGAKLLKCPQLASYCGLDELYVINDGANPTGSLKDRSVSVAASKAVEFGRTTLSCDSTGNKAASVAAYAARAGLKSVVFCPASAPVHKLAQTLAYGAKVIRVDADYTTVSELYMTLLKDPEVDWYDCGMSNPYRYEGKKSYAYESCEWFGWEAPDRMVFPAACGMSIVKAHKGFKELQKLGLASGMPMLTVAQVTDYDSIAHAVRLNTTKVEKASGGRSTIASALAVRDPIDLGVQAAAAILESGGTGVTCSDQEIDDAVSQLAKEGLFTEPGGAIAIAGLRKLVQEGDVSPSERTVCVLTGTGFKDYDFVLRRVEMPPSVNADIEAIKRMACSVD